MRTRRQRTPIQRHRQMADDCLVLLQYCSRHPDETQTEMSLSRATGIPRQRINDILREARDDRYDSLLTRIACQYRFDFEVSQTTKRGKLLSVVYVGYC